MRIMRVAFGDDIGTRYAEATRGCELGELTANIEIKIYGTAFPKVYTHIINADDPDEVYSAAVMIQIQIEEEEGPGLNKYHEALKLLV